MTSPGQVAGATQEAAGQTAATAKDQAAQVSGAATSAASDVVSTTKEQAGAVAGEAISQVRDLLDQTKAQVQEQAGGAQQKLGESLRSLADELSSMGNGSGSGSGPAAELVRNLAQRGSALADYVAEKQPGELLQDLRSLAARRPGGFLLGALAAGIAAGRLTRGAAAASHSSTPATPAPPPTTDYAPLAYQTAEPTLPPLPEPVAPVGGHSLLDDDLDVPATPSHAGGTVYPGATTYPDPVAYPDPTSPGTTSYGTGSGL